MFYIPWRFSLWLGQLLARLTYMYTQSVAKTAAAVATLAAQTKWSDVEVYSFKLSRGDIRVCGHNGGIWLEFTNDHDGRYNQSFMNDVREAYNDIAETGRVKLPPMHRTPTWLDGEKPLWLSEDERLGSSGEE